MMRKIVAGGALAAALLAASGTPALAAPGPNGHNNRGLCTAYSRGSATGQARKAVARPFRALAQAAGDQSVSDYCTR